MKIEFVNHASFIVEADELRIMTDPWLEGVVFEKGWALLSQTVFSYDDFASITHIWFSHEHPDHFSPPNLRKIPEDARRQITILFHETEDRKVVDYVRQLGFRDVIELSKDAWYPLTERVSVLNVPFGVEDSWLCIKTPETTLLNINDCEVHSERDAQKIQQRVGPVDVLFTQFSYAGWVGNREESHLRRRRAASKLKAMKIQIETIKPRFVVPFASFSWFCHVENHYMNDGINRIDNVFQELTTQTAAEPVILYPGDRWTVGQTHDSSAAIQRYQADYDTVFDSPTLIPATPIDIDHLRKDAAEFRNTLQARNNGLLLRRLVAPVSFYVTDYQRSFTFSLDQGLRDANLPYDSCDVSMSSDALSYCFKHLWGWNTLRINGRLQSPKGPQAKFQRFVNLGNLCSLNNAGIGLGLNGPFLQFAFRFFGEKLMNRLSKHASFS